MSALDFLNNLQAYNTCEGEIMRIELLRIIQLSYPDYYWKSYGVPSVSTVSVLGNGDRMDPYQSYNWQITVPFGSYLTSLSAYSEQPEGFAAQIKDAGSEANLAINMIPRNTMYGNYENVAENVPAGPCIVGPNFVVTEKEKLAITLKNLSTSANRVQLHLEFAIPMSNSTTGRVGVVNPMMAA